MSGWFLCNVAMWRQARPGVEEGGDCYLVPCPSASRDPCLLNASNHRTIEIPPPRNPLRGLRGKELKVSTFSVMLLKLLCFKGQAAERQPQSHTAFQCTHPPLLTLDFYLQAQARFLRAVWGSSWISTQGSPLPLCPRAFIFLSLFWPRTSFVSPTLLIIIEI
jgi:hypothetical protein